jgi:hypothetical protein
VRNRNKGGQRPKADNTAASTALVTQDAGAATEGSTAEGEGAQLDPEPEPTPVDPFADVPVVNVNEDVSFDDFTDEATSDPRKYTAVNAAAIAERLPTVKGWKHERAMLVKGPGTKEFKEGSVYGTIQQIVQAAGRSGIPAYVVASMLRRRQVGNKRSHYCEKLPPIGWAEGWINTAVTKSIAIVHPTKQAPALRETVTEGEANANAAAEQGKIASNG